jgi:putative transposase
MIQTLRDEFPQVSVRRVCALFGVSRSWLYAKAQATTGSDEAGIVTAMETIVLAHPGYGYRRVTKQLQRDDVMINHKRVLRLMRESKLLCRRSRRAPQTTQSQHGYRRYPNLIRDYRCTGSNQVWVADLTYLQFPRGVGYLACVLDAWSRRCIGWALGDHLTTTLTEAALRHAIRSRQPPAGLIHHSDQGVQYANHRYLQQLQDIGAKVSMSSAGQPTENAQIESFFGTVKREEVSISDYQDLADARRSLTPFLDLVYNMTRLHSSLGYRPPAEYELAAS